MQFGKKEEKRKWYMDAFRVKSLRHHCVNEVNGRSSDVDYKSMFYIVCQYIFDFVSPPPLIQQCGPDYATERDM